MEGPRRSDEGRPHWEQHDPPAPIYVEVSSLLNRHLTGIGRFVARLLEALAPQTPLRLVTTIPRARARSLNLSSALSCDHEVMVDTPPGPADGDLTGWIRRLLRYPQRRHDPGRAGDCTGLYTMLRPPGRHFRRELGILYDFTPLILPWTHQPETCDEFGEFFTENARDFDKLVAISHSTRSDARWLCPLEQSNVVVGYPGPSMCVHRHASPRPAAREKRSILVVSTLEPRKNGRFLIDWFFQTTVLPRGYTIYWAGPRGWLYNLTRKKHLVGGGRELRLLGVVSDAKLCELYQRASFTIYPSLYEGFGFPVLDSLRHGAPVLCSFNSSLQEFSDLGGVYYFDPCEPSSLDQAYLRLAGDQGTNNARPASVAELNEQFSWDRLARTVLALCA
jgi:glycosyltransferase involved in cell wall biosynthesis